MIFHVVSLDEWTAVPGLPYTPASLAAEGFVHCSGDEDSALAIADAYYRDTDGPLLVLLIDEAVLDAEVRREGNGERFFPHVYGPVDRAAVTGLLEVRRDAEGRALGLQPWPGGG
ncbi:DUF952 domain-containing protein [Streptomyces sp. A3M-1-3]|uniref:DUF952 domain-containing protein n=1 Tax=Streptomyces sp. A3M-1-3 TaxID=2962044 RepID=UPI0020B73835|nr:DUF952 domain-containing protein [Streptomyces sp. A3M-1-3]MCP3821961.1 DUF952 domain-containing protein [Streptomyces sp. A3M-1-3]